MDGIIFLTDSQRKTGLDHFRFGENARISRCSASPHSALLRPRTRHLERSEAFENSEIFAEAISLATSRTSAIRRDCELYQGFPSFASCLQNIARLRV
jgi:hypothetical protein